MSTAPSNSAPKTPEQSPKPASPPKKSDSLKQTMCHDPFLMLSPHPIDRYIASCGPHAINPLLRTRQHLPPWLALTTPDCAPWTIPHRIEHHSEITSWNTHPWAWLTWPHPEIMCASHDDRCRAWLGVRLQN